MKRSVEYLAIGVAVGTVVGFVLGLLFAPASGASTRRRIAGEARRAAGAARELAERAEHAAESIGDRVEHYLGRDEELAWRRVKELREGLAGYTKTQHP